MTARTSATIALAVMTILTRAALGQQGEQPAPASTAIDSETSPVMLGGAALDVAFVRGLPGVSAGDRLESPRVLDLGDGACLRLLSGRVATLIVCGPARLEVERRREGGLAVSLTSGRGALSVAGSDWVGLQIAGELLLLRSGSAWFDAARRPSATLLSGEARLGGQRLPASDGAETSGAPRCSPPSPRLQVPLGDAEELAEQLESRRRERRGGEDQEEAGAEGAATCVDAAEGGAVTDPTQSTEGGLDPDARRDERGRLRVTLRVPARPGR